MCTIEYLKNDLKDKVSHELWLRFGEAKDEKSLFSLVEHRKKELYELITIHQKPNTGKKFDRMSIGKDEWWANEYSKELKELGKIKKVLF